MSCVKIKQTVLEGSRRREFDAFLYASLDEDNNGTPLSVLSALARLDVDPWEEAARLAQMPKKAAAGELIFLLAQVLPPPIAWLDLAQRAPCLIALLPRRSSAHAEFFKAPPIIRSLTPEAVVSGLLFFLIGMTILLFIGFIS